MAHNRVKLEVFTLSQLRFVAISVIMVLSAILARYKRLNRLPVSVGAQLDGIVL